MGREIKLNIIYNDEYSFSLLVIVDDKRIVHVLQDRMPYWEKPIVYDMVWDYDVVDIVRKIVNKLMNRVGKKDITKINLG